MATVLIGADICPIEGNRPLFLRGDAKGLFSDLLPEIEMADLTIANLECPLIEHASPISKTGPVFGEPLECINGIREAGIEVLGLANNHILDHGAAGLKNTIDVCAKANISTVGAGENLAAARRILIKEVQGIRVGILAMAEHEFSIATATSWGANPLDLIDYVRNVESQKGSYDYLIVLFHGGDEFHVPSPGVKDACRFMVEMGANAVIVQHPHCLGGYEEYRGAHIIYGQGALVMDERIYRGLGSFHEGFLVKLLIAQDASSKMEIIPFVQSDPLPGARRMAGDAERQFRRRLQESVSAVADDEIVLARWVKFCEERKHEYISCLLGHNRVLNKLNRRGLIEKCLHTRQQFLRTRNVLCCETHREALETIFCRGMI